MLGKHILKSRTLLRDAVANLFVRSLSVISSFALTVALARTLGAAEFGLYSLIIATVTVLAIPAQAGVPELVLRETAKAHHVGDWARMRGVWAWSTRIVMVCSIVIAIASVVLLIATNWRPGGVAPPTFFVALLFVPLAALGATRGAILRGLGKVVFGLLPDYLIRPLIAIGAVLFYVNYVGKVTSNIAVYLYIISAAISFVFGAAMLRILRPPEVTIGMPPKTDAKRWRSSAVVFAMMSGMTVLLQQMDILMLGVFSTDEQIGIYRIAAQCSLIVSFGLTSTLSAIAPHIIRAHNGEDYDRVRRLVVCSARFTAVLSIFPLLVIIFKGGVLIDLIFGSEFSVAMQPLLALALSQAVVAIAGPVSVLLVMTDHERVSARVMGVTVLINLFANLALIAKYGAFGAAMGTGGALVVQCILLSVEVRVRLGFIAAAFGSVNSKERC